MQSKATTVDQYLAELPEDRRAAVQALREVILANLSDGYEEGMQYGMIGYYVPHSIYPAGYHCDPKQPLPFACVASQKNHLAVYLSCLYSEPAFDAWFRDAWTSAGKKLDMGKGCVRFKRIGDVPLEVLGQAIARVPVAEFIRVYETARDAGSQGRATKKATSAEKTPVKKAPAKRAPVKTSQAKKSAAKKATTRPSPAKKAPIKKVSAGKPSVKKMTSSKTAAQPSSGTAKSARRK